MRTWKDLNPGVRAAVALLLCVGCLEVSASPGHVLPAEVQVYNGACFGDLALIREGLKRGASPESGNKQTGGTALICAAASGWVHAVRLLLDSGASANARTVSGVTAIIGAATIGHVETARVLAERGADVNAAIQSGASALKSAAAGGYTDVVALLLDKGARIDIQDADGRTALMEAIARNRSLTAKYLIERGANVNLGATNKMTALMLAAYHGHADLVALLIAKGADLSLRAGPTMPFSTAVGAAEMNDQAEIVRILQQAGAPSPAPESSPEPNVSEPDVALREAVGSGDVRRARAALAKGAKPDPGDGSPNAPLLQAAVNGATPIVKLLLERGVRVDTTYRRPGAETDSGYTALMFAASTGRIRGDPPSHRFRGGPQRGHQTGGHGAPRSRIIRLPGCGAVADQAGCRLEWPRRGGSNSATSSGSQGAKRSRQVPLGRARQD